MADRRRSVGIEDLAEIRRALRDLEEPFYAVQVHGLLPEGLRDIEPRELGRALLSRGLCVAVGYDPRSESTLYERARPRSDFRGMRELITGGLVE